MHERASFYKQGATPAKRPIDEEEQKHPATVPNENVTKKGKSCKESREDSLMEEVAHLLETTPCEPGPETPKPKGKMETEDTPPKKKIGRPKGSKTKKEKKKLTKKAEKPTALTVDSAKPEDMGEEDQDENSPTPEKAQVQVCRSIEGSCPTVFFARGQTQPPRWLLPEDARIKQIPIKKPLTAAPEAHKETMDAAEREGLQAPAAWVGLGELPDDLPADFRSLLVLGRSGSGKSTLLRALLKKLFPDYTGPLYPCGEWPEGRALIENFNSPEEGRACLTAVGLSSVPSWCKPYEVLSAGERYRANLALALQHRETHPDVPLVFDEWTSELDRDLAKVVSVAFSKRMRPKCKEVERMKKGKKPDAEVESSTKEAEEDAEKQSVEPATTTVNEDATVTAAIGTKDAAEPANADANADVGMEDASADAEPCPDAPEDAEMQDQDESGEDEICEDDPVIEVPTGSKDEEVTEGNGDAEDAEDAQASEAQSGGPYIFASCHEDVLEYLQPQYLILCESGAAPRLLKNPNEGKLPQLASRLKGVTEPIRHHLVGSWLPGNKKLNPFIITHKGSVQPGILRVRFEGGWRIDKLEKLQDGSYVGNILPIKKLARFQSLGPQSLHIQLKGDKDYGTLMKATRRRMPAGHQALALVDDPDAFVRNNQGSNPNYSDCRRDLLDSSGWYTPPEWGKDPLYLGLNRSGSPTLVRTIDFRHDAKLEKVDDNQRYLATYVGEIDGTLGAALENVSQLLDCPFTGLCTHRLDSVKFKNFQLGVITGPSGSGKSTMARDMFGPSPEIGWLPGHSVLSHFSSLEIATDLLNAAFLDLHTAMRPYESLSGGEQARAHMARVLALEALETTKVLVLDEFASLVDRPTAKRMAKGLQHLLSQRKLTKKIVVVSCHSDFVSRSFLEPDWLFETHNHRLLYFDGAEFSNAQRAKVAPLEQKLEDAKNKVLQTEKELDAFKSCMVQHAGHAFLSPVYRNGVAAFAGAWQVLSSQELTARKGEVETLERELLQLRDEVAHMKEPDEPNDAEEPTSLAELSSVPWTIPVYQLIIRRALLREWVHFREHHYKDKSLSTNAVGFVGLLNGRACCFSAIVPESSNWIAKSVQSGLEGNGYTAKWTEIGYPTTWLPIFGKRRMRRLFREHRTVLLPDFQGMGLASLMCDCLAVSLQTSNFDFTSQTVHPTYGGYRDRSPFWIPLPTNRNEKSALKGNLKYSHAFVGSFRPDGSQDEVLREKLRRRVMMSENQVSVLLQTDIPELS